VEITIHHAICGEQNKAWELLRTTLDDNSLAKKIAFQTDLQDSPPSGLQWLPILRGFLFGEFYLIIKTYPDNSPDVRNGRVFSHCLIIDKTDLKNISDLSPLLSIFKTEMDKTVQIEQIILTIDQQEKVVLKDTLQLRFNKVIQSFIKFSNNSEPIVWVGQKHFEIAVCKLWQLLSATQKENFNFGINFNPNDITKDKLSFLAIPDNTENKYESKGVAIIRKEDSAELKEFSEQFLAGEQNAIGRIETFIGAIEAATPTIKEISTIAKGIPTFENLEKEKDLKLLNTLSNIIAKYSPSDIKGISTKQKIVERISSLVESADESGIFLLRNFQINSFKGSEKKLSVAIEKWCSNILLDEKQNQKRNFVPFIVQVFSLPKNNWLVNLLRKNISSFLSDVNSVTAKTIWLWFAKDVSVIKSISDEIQNSNEAEKNLYDSLPKTKEAVLSEVKKFASKRNWFSLYATILNSQFDFETALAEQLKVDIDKNSFDGIEIITQGINPKEVIATSIANEDKRCILLSGKLCKTEPKLLADIQIENTNWQEVWLAAINNGNRVSDGLKEPLKSIHLLFNLLVNGKSVNDSLLEKISETDFANILNYTNRNKIWLKLSPKIKTKFLEKTSSALLESLSKNSTFQVPLDNNLSDYIISSNAISAFLYYNRSNIKATLPIFNTYSQLPEHILKDYISNYNGKLDVVDATQLGQLTFKRNYSGVAYSIYHKAYSIKQFKISLSECLYLLDIITRGFAWGAGLTSKIEVSEDEWWTVFTELSYSLYVSGPTENKIWTQAEGKDYDLLTKGTGKEVWISALQKLRKKNCTGDITVKKLLKAMLEENKRNKELKTLKDLWKKL
jgi:hypothetical protein